MEPGRARAAGAMGGGVFRLYGDGGVNLDDVFIGEAGGGSSGTGATRQGGRTWLRYHSRAEEACE